MEIMMNKFKTLGLIGGLSGAGLGSYFSYSAISESLNSATITAQQAGIYSAIAATILGISLAFIGITYNQINKNR
jgi:amino acid transporter